MEPLRPMKPMSAMKPMSPMAPSQQWWPDNLGEPSSSGGQDTTRYAFFQAKKLLLIERDGRLQRFRTGDHRITGVSQVNGKGELTFSSDQGPVSLHDFEAATD